MLDLLPDTTILPILQGPSRGQKWIVGSGVHGCWLGSYEQTKQRKIAASLYPGSTFFDIGSNVGFYTLLASQRVASNGNVVAFEPVPINLSFLTRHVEINSLKNVRVLSCAVSDNDGQACFDCGENSSIGHLASDGSLKVSTVRLDTAMAREGLPAPTCIKIDVEGAEVAVLRGATNTIAKYQPLIFLATHNTEAHRQCLALLSSLSYHCAPLDNVGDLYSTDELVARPGLHAPNMG